MTDRRLRRVVSVLNDILIFDDDTTLTTYADEIEIGFNVALSPQLEIGLPDKRVEKLVIGDHSRLYAGQIVSRRFTCGDYTTIHEGVWAYGRRDITIGHNGWFGRRCTLDAEGGFWVGNGFGAGQDSHMWSHIRHGDTLVGSRWLKFGEFRAGDDVWLTGRCTSAPAEHGNGSMAMVEANLTKGMPPRTIWGGNPAKDLTEKLGDPFQERTIVERIDDFNARVRQFVLETPNVTLWDMEEIVAGFDVEHRTYRKTNRPYEVQFMRWLLPEAKFVPDGNERIE